jgi:hypothetical protein
MPTLPVQSALDDRTRDARASTGAPCQEEEERRSEPRTQTNLPARLKVVDPLTSSGPSISVRVMDVSASGLGLKVPHCIYTGALVQVHLMDRVFFAEVRYCISAETEFQIGVRVKEIFGADCA